MTILAACGGSAGGSTPAPSARYTVGVNVSGLSGSGLVLQLNTGSNLAITADGNATFATAVASGTSYNVIVKTQPSSPAQTCTVANGSGTITAANVTGIAITCRTIVPSATMVYFSVEPEGSSSTLLGYPANLTGYVSPTTTFTLPSTLGLAGGFITAVTTDSFGYIYVSASTEVLVFAPTASGIATPTRTIVPPGPAGAIAFGAIALDGAGNVYLSTMNITAMPQGQAILEYAAGAGGSATPIRTIDVATGCLALAVDGSGNILCAPAAVQDGIYGACGTFSQSGTNEILLFTSGQSGNATPARTISLGGNLQVTDISVDPAGNIYVGASAGVGCIASSILRFQGGANGTGTGSPVPDIITGVPTDNEIRNLRFDAAGNLYVFGRVVVGGSLTQNPGMTRFAPAADGFASPISEILVTPPQNNTEDFFLGFGVH